ncbi:unnamed protein product [Polarella glacialis]|uniref:FAD-binding PCMH-type domain-containing protein n=1 Tax=Polarella glacialis TaxID=89957 RepID=A0A813FNN0_POLGL|nr:unnamed protein product [Polarella glacialis]
MDWVSEPCVATKTIRVGGGATFTQLVQKLSGSGLALQNVPALPQFTVAGAVATGTHGSSGVDPVTGKAKLGSQASQVISIEMVVADGSIMEFSRKQHGGVDGEFEGTVVSMGCLGVVVSLTLELVPDFIVRQRVYVQWPHPAPSWSYRAIIDNFEELLTSCDSFSAFVDWPTQQAGMLVLRDFVEPRSAPLEAMLLPQEWHGGHLITEPLPPLLSAVDNAKPFRTTSQGPWHDVLFWYMEDLEAFGPQAPEELQFEWFVPLAAARPALEVVAETARGWAGLALYCELRAVRRDDLWLSPSTVDGCDSLAIAFGFDKHQEARAIAAAGSLEKQLGQFHARPHWGKLTSLSPIALRDLYGPALVKFKALCKKYDPPGKFRNRWANRFIFGEA